MVAFCKITWKYKTKCAGEDRPEELEIEYSFGQMEIANSAPCRVMS